MPYTKRTSMRSSRKPYKKYYKKKSYYKKTTMSRKKFLPEMKLLDSYQSNQAIGTSAAVYGLTVIVENDDYKNRTGLAVQAKALYGRINVYSNVEATSCASMRVFIVVDKECNGVAPIGSDILEDATNFQSPILHTAGKRFTVLYDRTLSVGVPSSGSACVDVKFYKRLNHVVKWKDQFGSTPAEGTMFIVCISDNALHPPKITFFTRLRFLDM